MIGTYINIMSTDNDSRMDDTNLDESDPGKSSEDTGVTEAVVVDINTEQLPDSLEHGLIYGINERPPWISAGVMAVQHFAVAISGCLTLPYLLSQPLCLDEDRLTKLIGTNLFICGVSSILQTLLGARMPIIQGPSGVFLLSVLSVMNTKEDCQPITANSTSEAKELLQQESHSRINEIQGAFIIAAVVESLIGFTGLVGLLSRYIGPIPIAVTITSISFSLIPVMIRTCQKHWGTAVSTIFLIILFSQFLSKWNLKFRGWEFFQRLFLLFPILLGIAVMWIVSFILTLTDVFPNNPETYGYFGRTDIAFDVVQRSPWISVPYPGQWGVPTFHSAGVACMVTSVFASILLSVGNYHASAFIVGARPPPSHAVNRGIGIEGVICLLAASCGTGVGYTSYTVNVAALKLTKVASRVVIYITGLILISVGLFTKFSAFCSTVPAPLFGACFTVLMGMVAGIGLANLNKVKMDKSRNIFIVGFSFILSLAIPDYLDNNPDVIKTGLSSLNQLLSVILGNGMLIGGVTALLLDVTISGTPEERGLCAHRGDFSHRSNKTVDENEKQEMKTVYDLPVGMSWIQSVQWLKNLPFCPTFTSFKQYYGLRQ